MDVASDGELKNEQAHLHTVIAAIRRQLATIAGDNATVRQEIMQERRHLFETESHDVSQWDTVVELATYMQREYAKESVYTAARERENRLRSLLARPYFGCFDFREQDRAQSERLYVGIQSFVSEEGEELVCDWRAPVSSLFYEDRLGRATYVSPLGPVEADIVAKRQFIIKDGELKTMFDTELAIGDDVLCEMLADSGGERMHPIVATIQREQNLVIRDADHRMLVVQGVAGSGKSSVAMQRVAYLLYRNRGRVRRDQILVFSPNELFRDYISRVLPELGEEDVAQSTFLEWAHKLLGSRLRVETTAARMDMLLGDGDEGQRTGRREASREKSGIKFVKVVAAYADHLNSGFMPFADLIHEGNVVVEGKTLKDVFTSGRATLSLEERIGRVRRVLKDSLEERRRLCVRDIVEELESRPHYVGTPGEIRRMAQERADGEIAELRRQASRLPCFNAAVLYRGLYDDHELLSRLAKEAGMTGDWPQLCRISADRLASGRWPREDLAPAMLLRTAMSGAVIRGDIKYVIVDEAQDYSPCEWEVFRTLFPRARFTVVGDVNQAFDDAWSGLPQTLAAVFPPDAIHTTTLNKSYRQTRQLAAFGHALLAAEDGGEWLQRDGSLPRIIRVADERERPAALGVELARLLAAGARSIAVIGKTSDECLSLMQLSRGHFDAVHITEETGKYPAGVVVIPSYLAKGLEFDAVIIPDAGADRYPGERERRLLYMICTRALHELCAFYTRSLTPLMERIDPQLYATT